MGFQAIYAFVIFIWLIISFLVIIPYISSMKDLNYIEAAIVIFIFLIGGPVFGINHFLTLLLDNLLPEGWDDDDDNED